MNREFYGWQGAAAVGARRGGPADLLPVAYDAALPPGGSLQGALALLPEGGRLRLGPGRYEVKEPLYVRRGCTISGAGRATELRAEVRSLAGIVVQASDVRLEGFRLTAPSGLAPIGISGAAAARLSITDVEVDGCAIGVYLLDCGAFEVRGCRIRNRTTYGIAAAISGAPSVALAFGSTPGYWRSACELGRIVDNAVEESEIYPIGGGTYAIYMGAGVTRTLISGNNCAWSEIRLTNSSGLPAVPSYGNLVDTGDNVAGLITVL